MSARWFTVEQPRAAGAVRVVTFPFAGGSASTYRGWTTSLPATVELCLALLPGRERRISEPAIDRLRSIVDAAADALADEVEPPFVLFGHSMGATVAYELTRELAARGAPAPAGLIVSGRSAPHIVDRGPAIHTFADAEFVEALRELGGTPAEVLEHAELLELLLPSIRADFAAVETYEWVPGPPLDCPLVAYAGLHDDISPVDDVAAWSQHTALSCEVVSFDGDHFFVGSRSHEVARRVGADVVRLARG